MIRRTISILMLFTLLTLCSCASYKSTWDCPKAKGIGCSSVEYADQIARQQIIVNKAVTLQVSSLGTCAECDNLKE